jgi:hypothetical protein
VTDQPTPEAEPDIEPGDIVLTRHRGQPLTVVQAPARASMALGMLAEHGGYLRVTDDRIEIADQVAYRVTGYDAHTGGLLLELAEDWRPAVTEAGPTDEDFLVAVETALEAHLLPAPGIAVLDETRSAVMRNLLPLVAQLRRERDLAIAHDRQPYPTTWAYQQACAALEKHRQRADDAEARRDQLAATLREVLTEFRHDTHPGWPCKQSSHVSVRNFDRWQAILNSPKEQS